MHKYNYLVIIEWRKGNCFWPLFDFEKQRLRKHIEEVIIPSLQRDHGFKKYVVYCYKGTGHLTPMNIDIIFNPFKIKCYGRKRKQSVKK